MLSLNGELLNGNDVRIQGFTRSTGPDGKPRFGLNDPQYLRDVIALVERVESDDPTALIGLPLIRLTSMLQTAGIVVLGGRLGG